MLTTASSQAATKPIRTLEVLDERTLAECIATQQPAVYRSAVSHWPMVKAAGVSFARLSDYLMGFDQQVPMQSMIARAQEKGRIFYRSDFRAFNFQRMNGYLNDALDFLGDQGDSGAAPTFYIGSMEVPHYLPGLERDCVLDVLPKTVEPKIWIGNKVVVPTHNDNYENIACVTAGRRRFTLFPPEQEENLYIVRAAKTPAGREVSRVDVAQPDMESFPRYKKALQHALVAELEPGDAIYIPYQWWHNVESLAEVNVLVNFWWKRG